MYVYLYSILYLYLLFKKPNFFNLQFKFCPTLGAARGGAKFFFLRFAQILPPLDLFLYMPLIHGHLIVDPANIKTAGGYTSSNIRQASLELGGVSIPLFDVGLGGILKGSHPDLSYIRNRTCDSA